ncbi:MAG: hypothetical protein A4E46_01343 [Methanosaeta sp. PtaU1.Bin016]|nr:MAG: hypothetical protein A4E46_01343 [Methanosaeta sp. PtaU1.Bin016]
MDSRYTTIGGEVFSSTPRSRCSRVMVTSKCSSPIPAIRCSPVSSLMVTCNVGSSLAICLKTSTTLGRSRVFLASTATTMTGSETCLICSKGVMFSMDDTVDPTIASLSPVTAAMFPAGISGTSTLSAPMTIPVC